MLSEQGVPKWIEKLRAALVRLSKDPEEPQGMKLIQFLSHEVWATRWDTKESYANKYHQKQRNATNMEAEACSRKHLGRAKSIPCRLNRCWAGEEESTEEKSKRVFFWFVEYDGHKFYTTKAGDTYNVQNDPQEKC